MQEEKENEELQINLGEILRFCLKKWWIVLIALLFSLSVGFVVGKVQKKTVYKNEINYALYYSGGTSASDGNTGITYLVNAIGNLTSCLRQDKFYDLVIAELDAETIEKYEIDAEKMEEYVTVSCSDTSARPLETIIYITVETEDAALSYELANIMAGETDGENSLVVEYLRGVFSTESNGEITYFLQNNIEKAKKPESDSSVLMWTAICGILGLVICVVVLGAIVILDTRVKGTSDLTEKYNAAILGAIPELFGKESGSLKYKN